MRAFDASRPRCPFCNRAIRLGVAAELPSRLRWPSAFRLIRMSYAVSFGCHYQPDLGSAGPSWLNFIGQLKDIAGNVIVEGYTKRRQRHDFGICQGQTTRGDAEASAIAHISPENLASFTARSLPNRSSMRIRSPHRGLTSSKALSGNVILPKFLRCLPCSRMVAM